MGIYVKSSFLSSLLMKFDFVYGLDKWPRFPAYWSLRGNVVRRDIFANNLTHIVAEYDYGQMNTWVERRQIEHDAFEEGKKLLEPAFFTAYLKDLDTCRARCKQFHRWMWLRSYATASNRDLVRFFQGVGEHLLLAFAYFRGSRPEYTKPVEMALQRELEARASDPGEVAEQWLVLTTPDELNDINEEQIAWDTLLCQHRQGEGADDRGLLEHVLNFSWLYPDELDVAVPLARLRRKRDEDTRSAAELLRETQRVREKKLAFHVKREALLAQLNDDRIRYLADVIALSGFKRMQVKDCWAGMHTICGTLWLEASSRLGVDPQELFYYYLPEDIERALETGQKLDSKEIARRDDYTMLYLQGGGMTVTHGPVARQRGKALLAETLEELNTDTLRGQVASRGWVRGRARLVTLADFDALQAAARSFREGDIMVTQMTQPNMVPLARRAGAIVTDEGGIASHAAIISREFNIPCIVGTKLATKVIRDGDLVEVDAEAGVITVVRRAVPAAAVAQEAAPATARG